MIFLTVGNATQGFQRLLSAVDHLTGSGCLMGELVFVQSGHNPEFRPSHCQHEPFLGMEDFAAMILGSDLIICHGGAGTLLHVLRAGKVPVVVPRRKQYGEHVDDHQIELAKALAAEGRIISAYEPRDLPAAIAEARRRNVQVIPPPSSRMVSLVSQAIEELIGSR